VGGGVGALEAMLAIRALARERVSIDLIAPNREFVYRPLSVLEPFEDMGTPRFDLSEMVVDQGARHHVDSATAVDADRGRVLTASGREVPYDALVVSVGATGVPAVEGALTFRGPNDGERLKQVLLEAERGIVSRIAFVVPPGVIWTLPLYELALNTAAYLKRRTSHKQPSVVLVTPEESPLALFGPEASEVVQRLLEGGGVEVRTSAYPDRFRDGRMTLVPHGEIEADRVVTLPRLEGPRMAGLPADEAGFIPVDEHCRVHGLTDVYAVGDATSFPIKQGGITAEQADVAAEAIAFRAGALLTPHPFRPRLRGLLLTGSEPRFLTADITRGPAIDSEAGVDPLWWPPSKIPGRYMTAYLAERGRLASVTPPPAGASVPFEFELDAAISSVRNAEEKLPRYRDQPEDVSAE
jgi:sulfide:quinone oxidoreductase